MQQVKGIVFVLAGLGIVVTLFSLLIPSKVMTVRSVVIHGNAGGIYAEISDLKKWKDWHPVFMNDSSRIVFSEPASGKNAFATWYSAENPNKLLITEALPGLVKISLLRKGEKEVVNMISISKVAENNSLQVEWRVLTTLKWYPWEKFYGIFIDKITGPGYQAALNNLKEFIENKNQQVSRGN